MVYLYLPSCRVLHFSASLCCFLRGIWRSLTLPPKSIVFATYSPPILLYLLSSSPSPLHLFSPPVRSSLLPRSHHCLLSLISCLILFVLLLSPIVPLLPDHISPSVCIKLSSFPYSLFYYYFDSTSTCTNLLPFLLLLSSPNHLFFPISSLHTIFSPLLLSNLLPTLVFIPSSLLIPLSHLLFLSFPTNPPYHLLQNPPEPVPPSSQPTADTSTVI